MKLHVTHGRTVHELVVEPSTTLQDVRAQLQDLTGALPRTQKLICKGRVLESGDLTVEAAKLKDGAKLMLLCGAPGTQTQGQSAATELQKEKAEAASKRARTAPEQKHPQGGAVGSGAPATLEARSAMWAKTRVIALRGERPALTHVPAAALAVTGARVADFSNNALDGLPEALGDLAALQRLRLSHNRLPAGALPALAPLTQLLVLALDHNRLEELPPAVCSLPRLHTLDACGNALTALPAAVSQLTSLRALAVCHNRLAGLPAELGGLPQLRSLDARQNRLAGLPSALGGLQQLRSLLLDSNRLTAIPAELLRGCEQLATLSLHDNPVTLEALRESDGFLEFNKRRCQKYDKQMTMRVMSSPDGFDEGADAVDWQSWGAAS